MTGGVYIAVFRLVRLRTIRVGRLGAFRFPRGVYFYVGSAQRNLAARLARHGRRRKPLRWHIDYLSRYARLIGTMEFAGGRSRECALARRLAREFVLPVPGFGSSDCRCPAHLFYASDELFLRRRPAP